MILMIHKTDDTHYLSSPLVGEGLTGEGRNDAGVALR